MTSKILIKSFLVNAGLTILKLLGAFFSHSLTLMGDGIHCLSDMATDIVGLLGSKLANKKPDKRHPYGYGKIEYLTSIIISIFIISLGIGLIYNSFTNKAQKPNQIGVIIIFISILIKIALSKYLLKKGKELNSNILITNGIESKYDSFSSIFALIFIGLSLIGKHKIFLYFDHIGSITISLLTISVGISLLTENIHSIIGEVETDENKLSEILEIIKKYKRVKLKELNLIKYGSYYIANISIKIKIYNSLMIIDKIKKDINEKKLNIKQINISLVTK